MKLSFLGATQTVTGSRFLVEHEGFRVMIDCGLFQGPREWKQRNWDDFPVEPASVDAVILTHAHIDHSGYLPRFAAMGFRGPVYCTPATAELLALMLPDSGHLQEEDAEFANKTRYTKHDPAVPLYTEQQARDVLNQLRHIDFYVKQDLRPDLSFTFLRAGHILGSGMIGMIRTSASPQKILFSGDLGRPTQYISRKPDEVEETDFLVLESTYGNRLHEKVDVKQRLAGILKKTAARGGILLVPAFSIGRTQELLFLLRMLEEAREVPKVPVYIDSPMAIHALPIYNRHNVDFSEELKKIAAHDDTPFVCHHIHAMQSVEESKQLNDIHHPAVIISASGMATGGRVLHHLKQRIGDHKNTILFIGFQAVGTKGRYLVDGARSIKIHGHEYPVHANVEYMDGLSAHADYEEMLQWLTSFRHPPKTVYLVHGEEEASAELARRIRERFQWNVHVPHYLESIEI